MREPPMDLFTMIGRAVQAGIKEHKRVDHRAELVNVFPHAESKVPEEILAHCIERLENECDMTLYEIAEEIDVPPSLLQRELMLYWRRLENQLRYGDYLN